MRPLFRLLPALIVTALLLAACGEKEEPDLGSLPPPPAPAAPPPDVPPAASEFEILGDWQGRLEQKGLKPFRVTVTIASLENAKRNPVHYSGIDCSGTWDFLGRRGPAFRFREVIDRGRGGDCKGAGTVTLTPAGADRLDYEFRGGGIESSGSIVRRGTAAG